MTSTQPEHIQLRWRNGNALWGAFDNRETEISAAYIVSFCQERGEGWEPLPLSELEDFYARSHNDGFTFNRLTRDGYVTVKDGVVTLTDKFINKCHEANG